MAETPNNVAATAVTDTDETAHRFEFDFSPSRDHNDNWHNHRQSHNPSKLPAFRFADLRQENLVHPSLLTQSHEIPPSPVSPGTDPTQRQGPAPAQTPAQPSQAAEESKANTTRDRSPLSTQHNNNHNTVSPDPSLSAVVHQQGASSDTSPAESRARTIQTPLKARSASATRPVNPKRSASLGTSITASKVADNQSPSGSTTTVVPARPQQRRAPSYSETLSEIRSRRLSESSQNGAPGDEGTKEWAQGQRELLLPKTIQRTDSDGKRISASRRPPVSYRPSTASAPSTGGSAKIPPIRSFRSSGDRQSLGLDMNLRSPTVYDDGYSDSNQRDRTLNALEGRREDDTYGMESPNSVTAEADDSGDVFLKMAREEPEPPTPVTRAIRSAHRRPLSSVIPTYQPISPPQVSRRLSDQEASRSKNVGDGQPAGGMARALTYRTSATGNTSESKGLGPKPSPLTPRTLSFQDPATESASAYSRRRQSITDGVSAMSSRMSSLKQSGISPATSGRTYNSSPLAPKTMDSQKQDAQQGDHHTESSNSTAAPSTVWDELDDIKSRIHRLELTGKLPATSGAAVSRASDERPPTATTNATTMSVSPKRGTGGAAAQTDAVSTVSSSYGQKESHPLLQSAITKSKPFLSEDIYNALEGAASDAMTLSSMIGKVGEPGPISSAASNVGTPAVTDRQLRRKAEGICRSLTELCLALSENAAQIKQQEVVVPPTEKEPVSSPTITRFSGVAAQRRPSAALGERSPASAAASPRGMSRLEERRNSIFFSNALPSPSSRYSSQIPATPSEALGRRTSLMLPRTRRAGTEEPEDFGGRKSSILRTRRAGTEEPEELPGRQSSMLRTRRGTYEYEQDDTTSRFRAPSRTVTEIAVSRPPATREFNPQIALPSIETTSLGTSALPRRRLGSSSLNTRLVQPLTTSNLAPRRYMERTPDRETNNISEKLAEDRGQRSFSLAQNSIHNRTSSIQKRTRDSMLANSSAASQPGGYYR
ncbi:hypothetical protein SUNI508_08477 [Seiridium unicorne]|uniref:LPXTG-motif cell wall anchor domain protein n=1 Tax=Seiridium unicorne TaxID=138068 RepID=A0ABR2UU93_9PEZI